MPIHTLTPGDVRKILRAHLQLRSSAVIPADRLVTPVARGGFQRLIDAWRYELASFPAYIAEQWDCDDFAVQFQAFISRSMSRASLPRDQRAGHACYLLNVKLPPDRSALGVQAAPDQSTSYHRLNVMLVAIDARPNPICVEPQNGKHCPAADYPGKALLALQ